MGKRVLAKAFANSVKTIEAHNATTPAERIESSYGRAPSGAGGGSAA
jgi:hypothetical protein